MFIIKIPTVRDLLESFDLKQVTGDEKSIDREILVPDTNRPGLELTGYYKYSDKKRIVILGDKEIAYIKTMDPEEQELHFDFLTHKATPAIVIARGHSVPRNLQRVAKEKNFPILKTETKTSRFTVEITSYLDELLAPTSSLHGTLMNVFGQGVLIMGDSGVGKSELALELIKRGHVLIADDRVVTRNVHNVINGRAPEILEGVLEVRGMGIINVMQMFGASAMLESIDIDVVIYLEHWDGSKDYDRLGDVNLEVMDILGIEIPKLVFPVKVGRNMAVLVETAVTNFSLKQRGINSAVDFDQRVKEFLIKKAAVEQKRK